MNLETGTVKPLEQISLDMADQWILQRLDDTIDQVTGHLEHYELGLAAQTLYDFTWDQFCDWYVEMAKSRLYGEDEAAADAARSVAVHVLTDILKLLHPFMPFITEEIYRNLPGMEAESIMVSAWPKARGGFDKERSAAMDEAMDLIRSIRNIRAQMNVPPSRRTSLLLRPKGKWRALLKETEATICRLGYVTDVAWLTTEDTDPEKSVTVVSGAAQGFIPLGELVDIEKELERLEKELAKAEEEVMRCRQKLSNERFIEKAPEAVVEEEKNKLQRTGERVLSLKERIASLKSARFV
jgi:valyl-tRNA synthetase